MSLATATPAAPVAPSMQAVVWLRHGSPAGLALRTLERPLVTDDTVLVRVHAAALNASDWHLMRRLTQLMARMMGMRPSAVPGSDVAGVVEAVGRNVHGIALGDEVFGVASGSLAEYAVAPADRLAPKPRHLSFVEAAAMPGAGCTALQALREVAAVRGGERVVVYGAGGGVGSFAVQIAKALGAHVTAVSSRENLERLRSLGADEALDYTREDFTRSDARWDVVVDVGGDRATADLVRVLSPRGRIVRVGAPPGMAATLWRLISFRLPWARDRRELNMLARVRSESLLELKELADEGKLRPAIDCELPLARAADALRRVGTRRARGKVVLRVG